VDAKACFRAIFRFLFCFFDGFFDRHLFVVFTGPRERSLQKCKVDARAIDGTVAGNPLSYLVSPSAFSRDKALGGN
jgi:hypothetical protein